MAQPTKYLISDVSTEHESYVAVVECTPEYVARLKARMELAAKTKKLDEDFAWLEFYDGFDLYERTQEIDCWIEEHCDASAWGCRLTVMTEKTPDFPDSDKARVECAYLIVDDRSCFWKVRVKHSEQECELQALMADHRLFAE